MLGCKHAMKGPSTTGTRPSTVLPPADLTFVMNGYDLCETITTAVLRSLNNVGLRVREGKINATLFAGPSEEYRFAWTPVILSGVGADESSDVPCKQLLVQCTSALSSLRNFSVLCTPALRWDGEITLTTTCEQMVRWMTARSGKLTCALVILQIAWILCASTSASYLMRTPLRGSAVQPASLDPLGSLTRLQPHMRRAICHRHRSIACFTEPRGPFHFRGRIQQGRLSQSLVQVPRRRFFLRTHQPGSQVAYLHMQEDAMMIVP